MSKKIVAIVIAVVVVICVIIGIFVYTNHENKLQTEALKAKIIQQDKVEAQKEQALKAEQAKVAQEQAKKAQAEKLSQEKSAEAKKTNSNLANEKAALLGEMANVRASAPPPGGHYGQITESELYYQAWDAELNKIWGILKANLPASEMKGLTNSEVQWINTKAPYMPAYKSAGSGNFTQMQAVDAAKSLEQMTKERCYYLVNNYM